MRDLDYANWLNAQFAIHKGKKGKSKADLARALGLEPPAVSKILGGNRQIKAQEYTIMRRFFGLPVDGERAANVLLTNTGQATGKPGHELAESQNGPDGEWVIPPELRPADNAQSQRAPLQNFTVTDRLMEPEFLRDETVLIDLSDKFPAPSGIFVVSDKFSHMVRRCTLITRSNPVEIEITASDPSFHPQRLILNDFEIIGRVVARLQWI